MSNYPNEKTRMARIEAITNKQRAEQPDAQLDALNAAIERSDEETAAEIARAIRNRLLKDTDAEVALDRLGLTVPTGSTFTAWLDFFRHLGEALVGGWAQYRQALRDLPNQEGFPFAIAWPERPDAESDNQEGRQA